MSTHFAIAKYTLDEASSGISGCEGFDNNNNNSERKNEQDGKS